MKMGTIIYSLMSGMLISSSFFFFCYALFMGSKVIFMEWGLGYDMTMSIILDYMSLIFLGTVCVISGSIMKYSIYYMEGDKNYVRFVYMLMLFVGSMWFLIISPNMVSMLLGWDGLGLSSYCLVIYYQNESSCNAGMITIMSNRVGDVGILLSIGLLSWNGHWNYFFMEEVNFLGVGMVVLAGMTKSAQIPFSAWLPAAMAAPTPVSSLVHSSTLVTAGVYVLIRFNNLLMGSGWALQLLVISCITMLMSGINANLEMDMKKVVALSTLSQLGLMMMSLSVGLVKLAFFHLIMHAMFKSVLFMCVGYMIHSMKGYQDSRMMSGLNLSCPVLGVVLGGSNMALLGFPFLAGFYSKDLILEGMFSGVPGLILTLGLILGTGLTVSYSFRVLFMSANTSVKLESVSSVSDSSVSVISSLSVLLCLSVLGGSLMSWSIFPSGMLNVLSSLEKVVTLGVSIMFGATSVFYLSTSTLGKSGGKLFFMFLLDMWFLLSLSSKLSINQVLVKGGLDYKVLDKGWSEAYGGGQSMFKGLSSVIQVSQRSLLVSSYLMWIVAASIIMVVVLC